MIYLYKKTSPKGLNYLGKTVKDPYQYAGSGTYWKRHLKANCFKAEDLVTEILFESNDTEEIKEKGTLYSELFDVVDSPYWANLRPESGDGGDTSKFIDYSNRPKPDMTNHWSKTSERKKEVTNKISESRKGIPSGFKEKRHTEEAKEKNRQWHLGKEPANKGKPSPFRGVSRPEHSKRMQGDSNSNAKSIKEVSTGKIYSTILEYKQEKEINHYQFQKRLKENKVVLCQIK